MAFLFIGIIAGFGCVGAFLWSVIEENPKPIRLIAGAFVLAAGIAAFLITK